MKKLISIICIFIVLLLVLLTVEYAQLRQPNYIAINNAVSWAQYLVGKSSFPYYGDGCGSSRSYLMCTYFVATAYGEVAPPNYSAYTYWTKMEQHPGDLNAPRGSLVFFDRDARNFGLGHVALCTGNGEIVEAGNYVIKTSTISAECINDAPYLGWAWPPLSWPGRSGGSAAAAFIMNMDNFIKESIKSTLLKLHIS